MKCFLRILRLTFVLISTASFANTINYTNLSLNFTLQPNLGSGDNMAGSIVGPGINLFFDAGTNWFFSTEEYAPGSRGMGGGTDIFPDFVSGTIGSQNDITFGSTYINIGSFRFPKNRKDFTVTVPASVGLFYGVIIPSNTGFTLATNPGELTLSFYYEGLFNAYFPVSGSFVSSTPTPEPGALGLMAIGLGGIGWLAYRQRTGALTWEPSPKGKRLSVRPLCSFISSATLRG